MSEFLLVASATRYSACSATETALDAGPPVPIAAQDIALRADLPGPIQQIQPHTPEPPVAPAMTLEIGQIDIHVDPPAEPPAVKQKARSRPSGLSTSSLFRRAGVRRL